jgi:DNA polymerase-3 subunit epsilon
LKPALRSKKIGLPLLAAKLTGGAMKALAIDFETANEDPASACSMGLAWIDNGVVTRRDYRLIRPREMRFAFHNVRIHGIRVEDVKAAPEFPEVVAEFIPELSGRVVLAHNATFDVRVLCAALASYGRTVPEFSYLCTTMLSRQSWPEEKTFELPALAQRLGIKFQHHHAAEDAYACAEIAVAASRTLGATGIRDAAQKASLELGKVNALGYSPCELGSENSHRMIRHAPVRRERKDAGGLRFLVRGSKGNEYEISEERRDGKFSLRCSCPAGQNRRVCKHVTALHDGDVTNLLSDNYDDVKKLAGLAHAFPARASIPQPPSHLLRGVMPRLFGRLRGGRA